MKFSKLRPSLEAQGWQIKDAAFDGYKLVPPDPDYSPIPLRLATLNKGGPRQIKNLLAQLRRAGWDPAYKAPKPAADPQWTQGTPLEPAPLPPFHTALRDAREDGGFTQADVAEVMGLSAQAISHWELEVAAPVNNHYQQLLELFPELHQAAKPNQARPHVKIRTGPLGPLQQERAQSSTPAEDDATPSVAEQPLVSWLEDMRQIAAKLWQGPEAPPEIAHVNLRSNGDSWQCEMAVDGQQLCGMGVTPQAAVLALAEHVTDEVREQLERAQADARAANDRAEDMANALLAMPGA